MVVLAVMLVVMVVVLVEAMVLMGVVAKVVLENHRQVKSPILYLKRMTLIIVVRQNPTALVKKSIMMLDF